MKAENDALVCWEPKSCQFVGTPSVWHRYFEREHGQAWTAEIAQPFFFGLTCDVTGDPDVNETWFPSTNLPGLSNAVGNFQIDAVVGAKCKAHSTPSLRCWRPSGTCLAAGKICRLSAGGPHPIKILDPPLNPGDTFSNFSCVPKPGWGTL